MAAASPSTRRMRIVPIRTLRNICLNPNFGGEVMVVSLGCEKLQPDAAVAARERFRSSTSRSVATSATGDEPAGRRLPAGRGHVGFLSMIDSIMAQARERTWSA